MDKKPFYFLIAGAGQGIGLAVSKNLLENYPNCIVLAISRKKNQNVDQIISSFPNRYFFLKEDVSQEGFLNIELPIKSIPLKYILFTAGVLDKYEVEKISKEEFNKIFDTNVWGFINLIKSLLPHINNTHIVSVGSMGGLTGTLKFPGMSVYSSSKAALSVLSECFSEDLKSKNCSVNSLAIGSVQTKMFEKAFPKLKAGASTEEMSKFIIDFVINRKDLFNGKTIPVTNSTP